MIRENIIKEYARGKDVLDIGAVGQTVEYDLWSDIKSVAQKLTGIDIMSSGDKDIIQGNMETHSFGRKFDVIVLGDIIEHVDNQGLLLDNIRTHLKEEGVLIITTPNAKWPTVFLPANKTHVRWHDRSTLRTILSRHGFRIRDFRYYFGNKKNYNFLQRLLTWHQAILAVCVLDKER